MNTIIVSPSNKNDESLITELLRRLAIPFQVKNDFAKEEQRAIHELRTDLRYALLEAEAIRKGQQEGTTWQAFLAELDQESQEMEATNGLSHSF